MPIASTIQYPIFMPAVRQIASITQAFPAVITTTFAHGYLTGAIVKLYVPAIYGMAQANQLQAPIIVTGDTTFSMAIDTSNFDAFVVPVLSYSPTIPQVVPIGETTDHLDSAFMNILQPLF